MNNINIKPELPGGFRDYPPEEMIPRQQMFDTIRRVYERFGYEPLDTPIIERLDVLTGGNPHFNMHLFRTGIVTGLQTPDPDAFNEIAIRFDLTVALARFVAAHPELPKPFKRYQVGTVARGERQQHGRYRAFTQFDVDIVGTDSMLADAEIIMIMVTALNALGVDDFIIRINNRKILNGIAELLGYNSPPERTKEVMRILDKMEKISWKEITEQLQRAQKNSGDISAPNLTMDNINKIKSFLSISGDTHETIKTLRSWFPTESIGAEGVSELARTIQYLQDAQIPQKYWKIDVTIARGLDYYTGTVFETLLTKIPEIGSVISGGRYNDLVNRFLPNAYMPAVGTSIGVDRLFAALQKLGKLKQQSSVTSVLIVNFGANFMNDYMKLSQKLRGARVNTQVYLQEDINIKDQLAYASKLGIPYVVLYGEDEKQNANVVLRNMTTRTQATIPIDTIATEIKKGLKGLKSVIPY